MLPVSGSIPVGSKSLVLKFTFRFYQFLYDLQHTN